MEVGIYDWNMRRSLNWVYPQIIQPIHQNSTGYPQNDSKSSQKFAEFRIESHGFWANPPISKGNGPMKAAEAVRLLAGAFAENGPPRRKLKVTRVFSGGPLVCFRVVDDVFCPEWSTLW